MGIALKEVQEEYRWVEGYENRYLISNFGKLVAMPCVGHRGGEVRGAVSNSGYKQVRLTKSGVAKNKYVHRLVAEAFIPNPQGKREVNHIDGNKSNNTVKNLEWVTSGENKQHAYRSGLRQRRSGIQANNRKAVLMDGARVFGSVREAASYLGVKSAAVSRVARGIRHSVHGHTFSFINNVAECPKQLKEVL